MEYERIGIPLRGGNGAGTAGIIQVEFWKAKVLFG